MRRASAETPPNRSAAPSSLDYAVERRIGGARIERLSDGVLIRARVPWARHWARVALGGTVAVFLLAIAAPSGDDWSWRGLAFHREGTLARVIAGAVGTLCACATGVGLVRRRPAYGLVLRGGLLAYKEATAGGESRFERPLPEIESIDHEPWDGEHGGTLGISAGGERRRLFVGLDGAEVDAIAAEVLAAWRAAAAPPAASSAS